LRNLRRDGGQNHQGRPPGYPGVDHSSSGQSSSSALIPSRPMSARTSSLQATSLDQPTPPESVDLDARCVLRGRGSLSARSEQVPRSQCIIPASARAELGAECRRSRFSCDHPESCASVRTRRTSAHRSKRSPSGCRPKAVISPRVTDQGFLGASVSLGSVPRLMRRARRFIRPMRNSCASTCASFALGRRRQVLELDRYRRKTLGKMR
jgi:hypothetical protein